MLRTSTKLKLAYAGLAAVDTWLSGLPGGWAHRARFVTKPLLMPTLTASLVTNDRAAGSPLRNTTVAGQVGGWGGDVALLGSGTRAFLAGAGSFAVGHLAYMTGFLRQGDDLGSLPQDRGSRAIGAAWLLTAPAIGVMAGRRERELGLPVFGYATLISAMSATAMHLDPSISSSGRRLTALGAGMFMVSDTVLGLGKFVQTDPAPELERVVMATYTAAQFLLSEGAARA